MSRDYMDEDNASDGFRDMPEEAEAVPPAGMTEAQQANATPTRRQLPTTATVQLPPDTVTQIQEEDIVVEEGEEDYSAILSDASLRLEQGNLYKMVMNSDLFHNSGYDEKAVANVTREIRNFAKERMEIMLGMRQEPSKEAAFPAGSFPFNSLEVEILKMLAFTASKGASQEAEPFAVTATQPVRKTTLNAITAKSPVRPQPQQPKAAPKPLQKSAAAPVKRAQVSDAVQRILDETGVTMDDINKVFDPNKKYLSPDELAALTAEQIVERNRQIALRTGKTVANPAAAPMPTQEHLNALYTQRAQEASAHPQMQMIMNAIHGKK
jgi:hypothetical protein